VIPLFTCPPPHSDNRLLPGWIPCPPCSPYYQPASYDCGPLITVFLPSSPPLSFQTCFRVVLNCCSLENYNTISGCLIYQGLA
jgi:hypothetical protein